MKFFDKRPVKCIFCNKQLYYIGHPKCEPEYQIIIEEGYDNQVIPTIYCHKRCLPPIFSINIKDEYEKNGYKSFESKNSETSPTKM
jgi:hypothetical protein